MKAAPWLLLPALAWIGFAACGREHDRLLEQFQKERPELRASAIERLGELAQEDDFPLFLKAARDGSATVRKAAAGALGRSSDPKAIDPLGELLADPEDEVQAEAATALSRFNTDKSRAYLLNAYGRQDAGARVAIARAVGLATLPEAVRYESRLLWDRTVAALDSGGPAERVGAAEELGRSGRSEAVERLLPLLGNDSVLLAAGAARGLGAARDRRASTSLLGVLKENYPMLREAAAEALGLLGDPTASPALERLALEGGPASVAAVRALGHLAEAAEARQALCTVASEGTAEVASLAARLSSARGGCAPERLVARLGKGGVEAVAALAALEALGGTAGGEKATALLDASDPAVRLAAARALAELRAPAAGPKVLKLLEAEAKRIETARQKWVAQAPTAAPKPADAEGHDPRFPDPDAVNAAKLKDLLGKVDAAREARAEALGLRRGEPRSDGPLDLADDLAEGQIELAAALSRAAGRLGEAGAAPLLRKLAGDDYPALRAAACDGLVSLRAADDRAMVQRCLTDGDRLVVESTVARVVAVDAQNGAPALLEALQARRSGRAPILNALGELKAKAAAGAIADLLPEGGVESVEAAVALGRIGEVAAVPKLLAALKDHTSPARLELLVALGALADASAGSAVADELCSDRPEVRAAAARALGRILKGEKHGALEALRFDYYAEVRRAADEALSTSRDAQGSR